MITGAVTGEGNPVITFPLARKDWPALLDTGFNGDLQLPEACRSSITAKYRGRVAWLLADNQRIDEDTYRTTIAFDGEVVLAMVSFHAASEILIGTHFLRKHCLTIDFVAATVLLKRGNST